MTLQEFKAWFQGYTENISKQPTQKQWARIQERVEEINGDPVTERIFIDRYWRWGNYPWVIPTVTWQTGTPYADASSYTYSNNYNSTTAFLALGQVEAQQ